MGHFGKAGQLRTGGQRANGLFSAPYENNGLPMGLMQGKRLLGKGIVNNCLLCHAGAVAGQTIIGMGNSTIDLQGLFEDLGKADNFVLKVPYEFSYVRGTIDPLNPLIFLMEFRDAELNVQKPTTLGFSGQVASDPPAWWLIKRKKTRDWTGGIDARSTRVDMANLMSPLNSGEYVRKQEKTFADIEAFVRGIEAPAIPSPSTPPRRIAPHGVHRHLFALSRNVRAQGKLSQQDCAVR